jgi:hypothetical protein
MKKHLLPLIGLTILSACHVGTYKKELCTDKNVVELINVEGEYKRIYKDAERLADITKGSHGKGSYSLREYSNNNVNSTTLTREVMTCKVGENLIAEYRDVSQRVWFDTDTLTFAFINLKDDKFVLQGINRKDMAIPSIDNNNLTGAETIAQFLPKDEYYQITFKATEPAYSKVKRPKILISE